jgi:hypothetical protein
MVSSCLRASSLRASEVLSRLMMVPPARAHYPTRKGRAPCTMRDQTHAPPGAGVGYSAPNSNRLAWAKFAVAMRAAYYRRRPATRRTSAGTNFRTPTKSNGR